MPPCEMAEKIVEKAAAPVHRSQNSANASHRRCVERACLRRPPSEFFAGKTCAAADVAKQQRPAGSPVKNTNPKLENA